jgi:hypothetical protein
VKPVRGAVVPHAPILVPGVSAAGEDAPVENIRAAVRSIELTEDVIVLLSAHGPSRGVYARTRGTLDDFGVTGFEAERPVDSAAVEKLAGLWDADVLESTLDHGAVVPLLLGLGGDRTVVVATLGERGTLADSLEAARRFAGALEALPDRCAFIASAHTSSALTPSAPLTEIPAAVELESDLVSKLERNVSHLGDAAEGLAVTGGSCSAGPLHAFGSIFEGSAVSVPAYEHPFGVGYLVACAAEVDR